MNILVLGAGQLARMMSLAGAPLNINIIAYDVDSGMLMHPLTLRSSEQTLSEAIAECDAITVEFEHIPDEVLTQCAASGKLYPGKQAIQVGGDRSIEKALLDKIGVPCAPYQLITNRSHLDLAIGKLGLPLVIKTCQAGYDGKGQWWIKAGSDVEQIWSEMSDFLAAGSINAPHSMIAETMIPFQREVSVIGARDRAGNMAIYPVTENEHTHGVLTLSVAKSISTDIHRQAVEAFSKLASEMDYVGVLTIEFFDVDGQLMVNEIAPRVHNSGHWTQQGTLCSQFENHLRAVAGLPLGTTEAIGPSAMINVLGQPEIPAEVLSVANVTSHWYGKSQRPGRKMGHINLVAESEEALGEMLVALSAFLPEEYYPGVARRGRDLSQD
ncbi:5-(carboxyamino)imidazole ribonucleotide synthase [Endozoicomonas sp. SCSIO W0465]|uniref:5-(carboxyamino)imidazole ribonucleotide synthase n=1 Tax=Endozoicomonas sp. SCSIO W0465 TaxID=2918516 RepID=UPI0020755F98|nr:5-(carboxyamino)imidazole ribonucleotide synthase [Endozoicomonas sp. SCSIO W0465]USE33846.1 5-(carboxyamino)imidazole ribonucleotide synthase [Endozoicomonas sp. SCSIO W0465]